MDKERTLISGPCGMMERVQTWGIGDWGSNPSFAVDLLNDREHVTLPFCASIRQIGLLSSGRLSP